MNSGDTSYRKVQGVIVDSVQHSSKKILGDINISESVQSTDTENKSFRSHLDDLHAEQLKHRFNPAIFKQGQGNYRA